MALKKILSLCIMTSLISFVVHASDDKDDTLVVIKHENSQLIAGCPCKDKPKKNDQEKKNERKSLRYKA